MVILTTCALAMSPSSPSSPSSLSFVHAQRQQVSSSQCQHASRCVPSRPSWTALSATYSPAGPGEEWTPEQEQLVMEQVLGRVPAASKETTSLSAEFAPQCVNFDALSRCSPFMLKWP
ncbi:unnamed protein product [Cladocopium goreaui]|uniref:DnaJ-like subfamily B member 7 n=1 Tax=Cladocopium goreaui TaxID=2562237 RepID=A0A9P1FNA4_9DINO|nr:unnamed protein product [Cladocopium goreaui]